MSGKRKRKQTNTPSRLRPLGPALRSQRSSQLMIQNGLSTPQFGRPRSNQFASAQKYITSSIGKAARWQCNRCKLTNTKSRSTCSFCSAKSADQEMEDLEGSNLYRLQRGTSDGEHLLVENSSSSSLRRNLMDDFSSDANGVANEIQDQNGTEVRVVEQNELGYARTLLVNHLMKNMDGFLSGLVKHPTFDPIVKALSSDLSDQVSEVTESSDEFSMNDDTDCREEKSSMPELKASVVLKLIGCEPSDLYVFAARTDGRFGKNVMKHIGYNLFESLVDIFINTRIPANCTPLHAASKSLMKGMLLQFYVAWRWNDTSVSSAHVITVGCPRSSRNFLVDKAMGKSDIDSMMKLVAADRRRYEYNRSKKLDDILLEFCEFFKKQEFTEFDKEILIHERSESGAVLWSIDRDTFFDDSTEILSAFGRKKQKLGRHNF